MNSQGTKNSSTKYSSIKCSSTNFNSLNSLITLQVQEFKLQAQEPKFQAQAFQVSSTSFKFKTEERFNITLTLKRAQSPKSFHNPNPTWRKIFIMVLTQLQTTAFFESPDQLGIPHETMVQIQREGILVSILPLSSAEDPVLR